MKHRFRSGGLAAWSINRPISVVMLALCVVVLGFFSVGRLGIDLLPHIIYPEVRVRILEPGVPTRVMEDKVTRQLEEQLSITEGAISIQSSTSEGASRVDISFPYGTDIDIALRDASTRLDRAKRFLPDTIDPPIIYKRDPSQIPVLELAISSSKMTPTQLREWVDYEFSRWFINLPGVAAAEIGGGNTREIQIIVDQERLASFGLTLAGLKEKIQKENLEAPGGRLLTGDSELSTRALGRFQSVDEIRALPLYRAGATSQEVIRLRDVARVIDLHEDERLRVRLNNTSAVKLSIQKQPQANTVAVVDVVNERMEWLQKQKLVPDDVKIAPVSDQSVFIRQALRNASVAAISGAILAMLVVYLFLGNLKRTLIIGTAIPLAILVTFIIMALGGLTLNIMTLGGLALGVGLLIDSTIIMLENITRHQRKGESPHEAAVNAAAEINSAIVAATSTNLAAILPFLFITGLIGLLFSDLIYTLSAAITAALVVALTLVPSLGARVTDVEGQTNSLGYKLQGRVSHLINNLRDWISNIIPVILKNPFRPTLILLPFFIISILFFTHFSKKTVIPTIDEGQVRIIVKADAGVQFDELDDIMLKLEQHIAKQPEVESVFVTSGGFIFGRTERLASNRGNIYIQLRTGNNSEQWIRKLKRSSNKLGLAGVRLIIRATGIRGINLSRGDDDISLRIQGADIETLTSLGNSIVEKLQGIQGLRNLTQTYEEIREEITVNINRERAADLGIRTEDIGTALRIALEGQVISEYLEGDRAYNMRMRLPPGMIKSPDDIETIVVGINSNRPIRIGEVADIAIVQSPSEIKRDRQRRIVEISASLTADADLGDINEEIYQRLEDFPLPEGYALYDGGAFETLKEGQQLAYILVGLAIFLVFVVMAVQYESLRNPVIILLSIPLCIIGVALGLMMTGLADWIVNISFTGTFPFIKFSGFNMLPVSMPVWLGMIMLIGIVVNNAIVLVEQIEILRERGNEIVAAIVEAARQRLRPILMTTITTVVGMLPLGLGIGRGSEMLQPLAIVIIWGLSFSVIVTLFIVPSLYYILHSRLHAKTTPG